MKIYYQVNIKPNVPQSKHCWNLNSPNFCKGSILILDLLFLPKHKVKFSIFDYLIFFHPKCLFLYYIYYFQPSIIWKTRPFHACSLIKTVMFPRNILNLLSENEELMLCLRYMFAYHLLSRIFPEERKTNSFSKSQQNPFTLKVFLFQWTFVFWHVYMNVYDNEYALIPTVGFRTMNRKGDQNHIHPPPLSPNKINPFQFPQTKRWIN